MLVRSHALRFPQAATSLAQSPLKLDHASRHRTDADRAFRTHRCQAQLTQGICYLQRWIGYLEHAFGTSAVNVINMFLTNMNY